MTSGSGRLEKITSCSDSEATREGFGPRARRPAARPQFRSSARITLQTDAEANHARCDLPVDCVVAHGIRAGARTHSTPQRTTGAPAVPGAVAAGSRHRRGLPVWQAPAPEPFGEPLA